MAGPLDIQRPARGLVDLLGLRALGDSPHTMADDVSGTLDLLDLYLLDRRTSSQTITPAAITGPGIVAFTPLLPLSAPSPGTALLLYGVTLECSIGAATTWAGALLIRRASYEGTRGYTWLVGMRQGAVLPASSSFYEGAYFDRPILVLPGDEFVVNTKVFTGASGPWPSLTADYARVSV